MKRVASVAVGAMVALGFVSCRFSTARAVAESPDPMVRSAECEQERVALTDAYVSRRPIGYADAATRPDLAIRAEVAQLGPDHPWAGCYESSDRRAILLCAPAGGCWIREWSGCLGPSEYLDWGRVEIRNGKLVLHLERQRRGFEIFDTEYTVTGTGQGKMLTDGHENRFTLEGHPIRTAFELQLLDQLRQPR